MAVSTTIDPSLLIQEVNLSEDSLKLKHPALLVCSGNSQSGKSFWLLDLIRHREALFDVRFTRIIYCSPYNFNQFAPADSFLFKLKSICKDVEFFTGIPNLNKLRLEHNVSPTLILVDDLMNTVLNSQEMMDFATKYVHHNSIFLACVFQSYFCPSKFGKTFMRNAHYKVLFYNRLDQKELTLISSQIANCPKFLAENFQFLIERFPTAPSYYLLIDGQHRSTTPHEFWCRSNIFPEKMNSEPKPIIFMKNPNYKQ